jgi:hypothetical protein
MELKELAPGKKPAIPSREIIDRERRWGGTKHYFQPDESYPSMNHLAEGRPVCFE